MRGIPVLCVLVLALAGSSAAQVRVGFLAAGDYGVGGSRELSLGLRMKGYESRNPANMLVPSATTTTRRARLASVRTGVAASAGRGGPGSGSRGCSGTTTTRSRAAATSSGCSGCRGRTTRARLGDAQLFLLDSNVVTDRQTAWLEQQLAESTSTWKIAVFHHPPYTCGGHSGDRTVAAALGAALRELRRAARPFRARPQLPALRGTERRHVRRPRRRRRRPLPAPRLPVVLSAASPRRYEHGFLSVSIGPDDLAVSTVDLRGRVTDRFSLSP